MSNPPRKRNPQTNMFDYSIIGATLPRRSLVVNLGVTFDSSLIFSEHIRRVTNDGVIQWIFLHLCNYYPL